MFEPYAQAVTPLGIRVAFGAPNTALGLSKVKTRWHVCWGRTRRQIADDYIASGDAKRRKDGRWDRRYSASRFVDDVESGKPSILA